MRINQNVQTVNTQMQRMANEPKTAKAEGHDMNVKAYVLDKMHAMGIELNGSSLQNADEAASMTQRVANDIANNAEAAVSAQANVNAEYAKFVM